MSTYRIHESQRHLLPEAFNVITHDAVVQDIRKIIRTGQFCSLIGIKKDGSLRAYNIHKTPESVKAQVTGTGNYEPSDHNLIRFWDRNARRKVKDPETGGYKEIIGGWAQAYGDGLIYFKKGNIVYDFTEINADKISKVDRHLVNAMIKQYRIFDNNPQIIKVE